LPSKVDCVFLDVDCAAGCVLASSPSGSATSTPKSSPKPRRRNTALATMARLLRFGRSKSLRLRRPRKEDPAGPLKRKGSWSKTASNAEPHFRATSFPWLNAPDYPETKALPEPIRVPMQSIEDLETWV
jgi:hypothetical protein